MKTLPLITALILTTVASALQAQTSSILIKSGDTINGTSSNSARLSSFNSVCMNDAGGIAFVGYASETNRVTNAVTRTNFSVGVQYTNVVSRVVTNRFFGTVTNVITTTNRWNVNGTTNTYISQYPQIRYATNGTNQTNGSAISNSLSSFEYTAHTPQGGRVVTNSSIVITNIVTTTSRSFSGIWSSDSNGTLNLMIRSGQPTDTSNAVISSFTDPVINNNGDAAFIGYTLATTPVISTNGGISNSITRAGTIYLSLQGSTNPIRVASVGAPAPGTSGNFTSFSNIALPDVGGVIFVGMVGTNQGVWVQNSDASVQLVALRGQSIMVGGTNKVISSFNLMNYGYPGVTRSYSQETGTITYRAYFTDGTSAAVRVNR